MIVAMFAKSQPELPRGIHATAAGGSTGRFTALLSFAAMRPEGTAMAIDWAELRAKATEVAQRAYAPYSRLRVGAAGLTADGQVITGCNVENASYGLTLCAECGLVSALHATAQHTDPAPSLVAVSVLAGDGAPLVPCGRCRQLLLEAGGPGLLLDSDGGPRQLGELLPDAFTGTDLAERRNSHG